MPAIFHVKIEDDTFDGAVNHIVEASDDDTVWHCEEAGDNFDGAIFHVKWAEDGHEEPVWRVSGISRGTVTTVGPAPSPLLLPDAIANSLQYVKAFGGTEQRNLPEGYIERQFIYMMDDSYLVPDIIPESDWHIEMDFQTTTISTAGVRDYFGGRYDNSSAGAGIRLAHTSSKKIVMYGFDTNNAYTGSSYNILNNTRYKYVYNNGSASLSTGGTVVDSTTFTPNDTTTSAVGINAYRQANGSFSAASEGIYLYSFKAWNGQGELVMNLVPAVQKGTVPVVGFYDTVSKTFKTATAGTFAAGGEAVPTPDTPMDIVCNNGVLKARHASGLPLGYTQLTYIQSDGRQMINTGYVLQETDSVEVDYKLTDLTGTGDKFILGAQPVSGAPGGFWVETYDTDNNWYVRYGSSVSANTYGSVTPTSQLSGTLAVSKNSFVVNGVKILTPNFVSMPVNPMTIFNRISLDGSIANFGASAQISEVRVKNGNNLVHRYIAVRNSNNELGMYDLVSGQFFTNAGTGDFVAGNTVNDPVEIYADGTVETIEDSIGNTATCEPLLAVGDYTDVQSILDGVITRNVGIKVLDGTESWSDIGTSGSDSHRFQVGFDTNDNADTSLCTHISRIIQTSITSQSVRPCIRFSNTGSTLAWYDTDNTTTLTKFKAWLASQYAAGTPVIVLYPLATPTTEVVAGQTLQVTQGDNVLEITQASIDGLELEAKYMKGVVASAQEVEPQGLDNNVSVSLS